MTSQDALLHKLRHDLLSNVGISMFSQNVFQTHLWWPQPSQMMRQTATWPVRPSVSPSPGGRTAPLSPLSPQPRAFTPVSHPNIGL